MKTPPQQRDVLRRLLGVATPRPWRENIMLTAEGQPLTAIVSGRPNPDDLRVVGSTLREPDGLLAIASANALADLLDDLDEVTQARDANARLLAAESARVAELTAERDALAAKLAEVRALHAVEKRCHDGEGTWSVPEDEWAGLGYDDEPESFLVCGHCGHIESREAQGDDDQFSYLTALWPCPTVAILDRDGGES